MIKLDFPPRRTLLAALAAMSLALPATAADFDEEAAKLLWKQNECGKCHNPEKAKKGPSLKKTAKTYKGTPDAEKKSSST